MDTAYTHSAATLLILVVLAVLPCTATAAEGAFIIKGGAMRLHDDGQVFETQTYVPVNVSLDEVSNKTFGIGWEIRLRKNWAVGTEYLHFENQFTQTSLPSARGITTTDAFMVSAKKYFFTSSNFHPYIGGGFGVGFSDTSNNRSGGQIDINKGHLLLHAMFGIELRVDQLSIMLETKTLYFDDLSSHANFDPNATGVLLGVSFNW